VKQHNVQFNVYVGDNVEVLRREVADNSVQLTVTSPPYDNLRTYNGFEWDFTVSVLSSPLARPQV
jgi:DNA modification methylase